MAWNASNLPANARLIRTDTLPASTGPAFQGTPAGRTLGGVYGARGLPRESSPAPTGGADRLHRQRRQQAGTGTMSTIDPASGAVKLPENGTLTCGQKLEDFEKLGVADEPADAVRAVDRVPGRAE